MRTSARVERGLDVAGAESPLGEYFERWLREHAARSVSARTLAVYRQTGRVFVAPIASVRLSDVRPPHIERALDVYLRSGAGKRTAAKHLTVLKSALARAVRLELIPHNPAGRGDEAAGSPPRDARGRHGDARRHPWARARIPTSGA